jgi:hypothetical protein
MIAERRYPKCQWNGENIEKCAMPSLQSQWKVKPVVEQVKNKRDADEMVHVNTIRYFSEVVEDRPLKAINTCGVGCYVKYDYQKRDAE